ncbi:hypothetical protein PIROE2DRAFT_6109 [Piromyces sp. E2]|nr:hypothetical protein PIROE2DRAFT_6109 [Piromyces sp. E2]|eukprot:OUM66587.1 hypothetical protein PIROE2DRAFT_6109 [Piromyces sp. E2]
MIKTTTTTTSNNNTINDNNNIIEQQISYVYHFYAITKYSFICRNESLYQLLYLSKNKNLHALITNLLENLAYDLGTKNYLTLLNEHLPSLIYLWIDDRSVKLEDFPFYYFNHKSLSSFFSCNLKFIIPNLILKGQYDEIDYISKHINKSIKDMILYSFPKIMAYTLPLLFQDDQNLMNYGKTIYNKYIKTYLPGEQFKNTCKENIVFIILELLYLIYDTNLLNLPNQSKLNFIADDKPLYQNEQSNLKIRFPNYKGTTVLKAIDYILNLINENSLSQFLNVYRLPFIFNFFHENIETTIYNEERHRLIYIYKYLITLISNHISEPFLYKSIIIRMLKYMDNEKLFNICSNIISYILDNSGVSSVVRNENMIQIITVLLQQIHTQTTPNNIKKIKSILIKYTQDDLKKCPIFIKNELCNNNISDFMDISEDENDKEENSDNLNDIIKYNNIDTYFSVIITIHYIKTQLDNKKIMDELANPQNKEILIKLFRKLLQWSDKYPLSQEILKCIGKLNPYLNLNFLNSSLSTVIDENKIYDDDISISDLSDITEDNILCPGHIIILKYLNECLYDYDISIVSIAISLIQSILQTKAGRFAFNHLEDRYKRYLEIFIPPQKAFTLPINSFSFTTEYSDIEKNETWNSCGKSYKQWITNLSCSLIISFYTNEIFNQLIILIEKHQKFSEHILPYIIYSILNNEYINNKSLLLNNEHIFSNKNQCYQEEQQQLINRIRQNIHDSAFNILSSGINSMLKNFENQNPEALRTILSVLIFLRKQPLPKATTQFDNNYWLNLDYKYVVQAAIKCNLYSAALLFIEISIDRQNNKLDTRLNKRKRSLSRYHSKIENNIQDLKWYQDLLIDIYQHTDPDDFNAINYDINKDIKPLLSKYEHEKNWKKQLIFYERFLHADNLKEENSPLHPYIIYSNIAKSLNGLNLYHLSYNMIDSVRSMNNLFQSNLLPNQNPLLLELQYESAWKISQWDFEPNLHSEVHCRETHGINYHIFNCLKYFKKRNNENFNSSIDNAWTFIETTIQLNKFDNKKYDLLSFQLINEIQEGWEMMNKKNIKYLDLWQMRMEVMKDDDFKTIESILLLRNVILNIIIESISSIQPILFHSSNSDPDVENVFKNYMISNLFTLSKIAQKTGNFQSSQNSIELLNHAIRGNEEDEGIQSLQLYDRLIVEEAKNLWIQEEPSLAINMIRKHIETITSSNVILQQNISSYEDKDLEKEKNEILYQLLSRLGHWIGIQRLENPSSIIENYMERAVKLMESNDQSNRSSKVYFKFADFANNQYQIMCQPDNCVQQKLLLYKEKELNVLTTSIKSSKSTTERNKFEIQKRRIETQIELDKAEINRVIQTREIFLVKAIENYLKTLNYSDDYDICVFRLIALWFGNKYNNLINQYIYKYIKIIESRKFLTLIYQLSARMSLTNADKKSKYFVLTINALIQKMILDHPYHCLYQIIALRNGDILSSYDIQYFSSPEKRLQHLNSGIINQQTKLRIQAAAAMLHSVKKHRNLVQVIQEIEYLSEAYIELAGLKFNANDRKKLINNKKPIAFGSKLKLSKVKELERVPITTKTLPVDPTCTYENIVYVKAYKSSFQLIGGINLPKVIECIGSDGNTYKQLVKGSDDLRQDAVLSKIFNLVNILLNKNQSTRKRQLSIRTYHIIPLSPRSGIIEWVQNTIPFGTYLTEAHPK